MQEITKCTYGLMKIDVGPMPRDQLNACLFPWTTGAFVFLVLEGNVQSNVSLGKTAQFEETRRTSMLKP